MLVDMIRTLLAALPAKFSWRAIKIFGKRDGDASSDSQLRNPIFRVQKLWVNDGL